jgi:hypothetical protein
MTATLNDQQKARIATLRDAIGVELDDIMPSELGAARILACVDAVSQHAALSAQNANYPPLTDAMIEAAMEGHYGKRRTRENGGARGIIMTANDVDYSGYDAFKRMWKAAMRAAPLPRASDAPDDRKIADTVNTLRDIAVQFHSAHQLRERIANVLVPMLRATQPVKQDLTADEAMRVALAGWKLVPIEPTGEMIGIAHHEWDNGATQKEIWRAMLAATPFPRASNAPTCMCSGLGPCEKPGSVSCRIARASDAPATAAHAGASEQRTSLHDDLKHARAVMEGRAPLLLRSVSANDEAIQVLGELVRIKEIKERLSRPDINPATQRKWHMEVKAAEPIAWEHARAITNKTERVAEKYQPTGGGDA